MSDFGTSKRVKIGGKYIFEFLTKNSGIRAAILLLFGDINFKRLSIEKSYPSGVCDFEAG